MTSPPDASADQDPFAADPPPWAAIRLQRMRPAARVPTMLSPEERRLYLWLGRDFVAGRGAIVDLGCFVGGSTAHLAEGNRRAANPVQIHAYDRFRVAAGLKQRMLYDRGVDPFPGQDMLPTATRLLAPWAPRVTLHRGLIERQAWTGGPIAVLVVDAAKSARVADAIAATFFPMVVPGGVIVHQDALHPPLPWILAQMGGLAPWCRPVAHAEPTTLVWQVMHPLDGTALRAARVARLSDAAMTAAIAAQRGALARFGVGPQLDKLRQTLADNPGARKAKAVKSAAPGTDTTANPPADTLPGPMPAPPSG